MTEWKLDHTHLGLGYIRMWFMARTETGCIYQSCYYTPNYPCPETSSNPTLLQLSSCSPSRYVPQHQHLSGESSTNGTKLEHYEVKMSESTLKLTRLSKIRAAQKKAAMSRIREYHLRLVDHPTEEEWEEVERINRIYDQIQEEERQRVNSDIGIQDAEVIDYEPYEETKRGRNWPAFTDDGYRAPKKQERSIDELREVTLTKAIGHQWLMPGLDEVENPTEDNATENTATNNI